MTLCKGPHEGKKHTKAALSESNLEQTNLTYHIFTQTPKQKELLFYF